MSINPYGTHLLLLLICLFSACGVAAHSYFHSRWFHFGAATLLSLTYFYFLLEELYFLYTQGTTTDD